MFGFLLIKSLVQSYSEDKFLDESESKEALDDMKVSGNYEVVYKSGEFK